jgi:hypothetical protein
MQHSAGFFEDRLSLEVGDPTGFAAVRLLQVRACALIPFGDWPRGQPWRSGAHARIPPAGRVHKYLLWAIACSLSAFRLHLLHPEGERLIDRPFYPRERFVATPALLALRA